MFRIVWRYEVKPEHAAEFERAYGADGEWAALFARGSGFAGVELFRGEQGSYVTIDSWCSQGDFEAFLAKHRADYDALDRATESWTDAELLIGRFGGKAS